MNKQEYEEYKAEFYKKVRAREIRLFTDEYLKAEADKKQKFSEEKIAHPNTMDKTPATILLIVGMIGSLIFKQWYVIWVILLMWYFSKDRV